MKSKSLIIISIIFFLLINTTYFWEGKLGVIAMLTMILLILAYIFLFIYLIVQFVLIIREKFNNKNRMMLILLITIVLVLTAIRPSGLINFYKFEGKDLIIAVREGVANCTITLKLKENNSFIDRNVCFGIKETKGKYIIKRDTIFFLKNNSYDIIKGYYEFAVIKNSRSYQFGRLITKGLWMYRNHSDTLPIELFVLEDRIKK